MWPTSCAASWRMRFSAARYGASGFSLPVMYGEVRPFEDQVVLAIAQRAEGHGALQDLAGARIRHRSAGAPAARRAMDPVDHVVADVHRVGAVGEHRDLEAVAEAGRFECLAPPARAFDQRLLHVFRRARVDPVLNRLDRIADRRVRVLLLQAVTTDVAHLHHVADRHAVVDVGEAAVAGARVVVARLVVVVGQLDEREMLAQRHRFGRRRHAADRAGEEAAAASTAAARAAAAAFRNRPGPLRRAGAAAAASACGVVDEGQRHFDFTVLRERLGPRQIERAARAIEAVGARPQRVAGAGHVAQQEVGRVDQHVAVGLAGHREAPQHRFGERVLDRIRYAWPG